MAFLLKSFLCIGCLAGVSSAVGVPVALTLQGNKNLNLHQVHAGGGIASQTLNLVRCSSQNEGNQEIINYGSSGVQDVCGFVDSNQNNEGLKDDESKYSSLFKSMWGRKTLTGSEVAGNNWKNNCRENNKTWYLSQSDGEEYLGVCDNSASDKKKGAIVENKNNEQLKINICQGECGRKGADSASDVQVLSFQAGNGQEVKFRKNSN